jgi:EAL domain-containing protein (putative c-di-GMP-specific phosphodiesterase class I)
MLNPKQQPASASSPHGPAPGQPRKSNDPGCHACRDQVDLIPFSMAFQPIVDLQTNQIDAHEALVRGTAGEPAYSILSQIDDRTRYAFDQACRVRAIELAAKLGLTTRLNINFLPNAVYDPRGCIRTTLEAAARTGFDPHLLTFEIVESEMVSDTEHLRAIITEYRRQGFSVALDDFGAGYSNLARLADLRPDIVKVDRALIQDSDHDPIRVAIVRNLVSLANDINIKLVFEGVERAAEVVALRDCGARFLQGYYFARPAFERILHNPDIFPPPSP